MRNDQVDRAFPELAAQEREDALRAARRFDDGPERRTAIVAALRAPMEHF